tara:strand:- start:2858 stop:2971 length:114 start_codon:yes stop_codon:yes gene_type:complete
MKLIFVSLVFFTTLIGCEKMPLSAIPSEKLANPSLSY